MFRGFAARGPKIRCFRSFQDKLPENVCFQLQGVLCIGEMNYSSRDLRQWHIFRFGDEYRKFLKWVVFLESATADLEIHAMEISVPLRLVYAKA
jgi:hypothetical protein